MKYSNWKEYIEDRFSGDEFFFEDNSAKKFGTYDIHSTNSTCTISFIWPNSEWTEIDDVQYFSSATKAWSGESIGPNPKKFVSVPPSTSFIS